MLKLGWDNEIYIYPTLHEAWKLLNTLYKSFQDKPTYDVVRIVDCEIIDVDFVFPELMEDINVYI